jgi:FAD/FMN-containing dehydrogenase
MSKKLTISNFQDLQVNFAGELYYDNSAEHQAQKLIYSTDASVYQEKPIAVAVPKNASDIQILIRFANEHQVTLIPRSALPWRGR